MTTNTFDLFTVFGVLEFNNFVPLNFEPFTTSKGILSRLFFVFELQQETANVQPKLSMVWGLLASFYLETSNLCKQNADKRVSTMNIFVVINFNII